MTSITTWGNGTETTFRTPIKAGDASVTVDGTPAVIASQDNSSVTLDEAPEYGAEVVITYTPVVPIERGVMILAADGNQVVHTGSTEETVVASLVVPGGVMGPHSTLRVYSLWSREGDAGNKRIRVILGGEVIHSVTSNTEGTANLRTFIRNRGVTNAQVRIPNSVTPFGSYSDLPLVSTLDTTQDMTLEFAVLLNDAADSVTLEGYTVEVRNP